MDFYFTATHNLISILVEDPEDDQISTPKEESGKTLETSFRLTGNPFKILLRNKEMHEYSDFSIDLSSRQKNGIKAVRQDPAFVGKVQEERVNLEQVQGEERSTKEAKRACFGQPGNTTAELEHNHFTKFLQGYKCYPVFVNKGVDAIVTARDSQFTIPKDLPRNRKVQEGKKFNCI
ncbi:hypothetical protein HGM15179_016488 [Zosterops borbonicus]|uniref:Uncharacterized protein n=1 Tax=Zosterops borbonicus TaxID=364589 RepID=A0A8K1G2I7_9PASS|nr:hypothetical protein HGM15179_016488 [Zosterops borbonicus]